MMSSSSNPQYQTRNHDFNIERFKTRLTAKSCVVFITVTQIIIRLIVGLCQPSLNLKAQLVGNLALIFYVLITLIICFEYFLFRKIGPKVMNYSQAIDIILLILFTAEWIMSLLPPFFRIPSANPHVLQVTAALVLTAFQWRILFLLFLVQSWKLIMIPPTIVVSLVIGLVCHYALVSDVFIVLRGILQIIYIVIMLYFLDKIKWKEILMNAQQEKWIKINDFVLNNIPENIVILEMGGALTFVSDYCKVFIQKAHLSQNLRELFTNIRELCQQPETDLSVKSFFLFILTSFHHSLQDRSRELQLHTVYWSL